MEFHSRWGVLGQEIRDVEVVWSPVHRDALGRLLLEQLEVRYLSPAHRAEFVVVCIYFR